MLLYPCSFAYFSKIAFLVSDAVAVALQLVVSAQPAVQGSYFFCLTSEKYNVLIFFR